MTRYELEKETGFGCSRVTRLTNQLVESQEIIETGPETLKNGKKVFRYKLGFEGGGSLGSGS